MDISKARLEHLIATGEAKFEFTRICNWIHIRDRETGEGFWVWNGEQKSGVFSEVEEKSKTPKDKLGRVRQSSEGEGSTWKNSM